MRRTLLYTLFAGLTLAPLAVHAQTAYDTRDGYYGQNGYYDHTGRWHANEANPYPDGYYDQRGDWHPTAGGNGQGGTYDRNGNWVPDTAYSNNGGYDNNNGGYYDQSGQWHRYDSDGYQADNNDAYQRGNNSAYGYGNVTGPERWDYRERGRNESLDIAARNFAATTATLAREPNRHSSYNDRVALDALNRLAAQASNFSRMTYRRNNNGRAIGNAYADLVNAFVITQRRFAQLRPDGWLSNQWNVLASAMGRLDKRYFGSRAFNGQNPYYGTSGYYPQGERYPWGDGGRGSHDRNYPY